ncbi:DEAD/DEAH box helicase [Virgibacillus halophilus]|uniref:DEAD/DEAH box helicase n=1 Tax=Tigheibacillus halophilus TaxID=361280 RepID=A0ABU5CCH1_9BACI|nr:DEAD/DEAH box helicase [Virgibacillus halophilus]
MEKSSKLEQQLFKYFHLREFRAGQKEIIRDILQGKDVLGVLPTGSGKSICYQLPAMMTRGAYDCRFTTYRIDDRPSKTNESHWFETCSSGEQFFAG